MKVRLAKSKHHIEDCLKNRVFGVPSFKDKTYFRYLDLSPGDMLIIYKPMVCCITGIWEVISRPYDAILPRLWEGGGYKHRVRIIPVKTLKPHQYIDVRDLVEMLEMVKNPEKWHLTFNDNLREIPKKDYNIIKEYIEKASEISE